MHDYVTGVQYSGGTIQWGWMIWWVRYGMYIVQCTVYSVHPTIQCTLYNMGGASIRE